MKLLTEEQIKVFISKKIPNGVPVRFLTSGQSINIITGQRSSKGSNIIHHEVYWDFSKETSREIAKVTETKAVFS